MSVVIGEHTIRTDDNAISDNDDNDSKRWTKYRSFSYFAFSGRTLRLRRWSSTRAMIQYNRHMTLRYSRWKTPEITWKLHYFSKTNLNHSWLFLFFKLKEKVDLNIYTPACLADAGQEWAGGTIMIIFGWSLIWWYLDNRQERNFLCWIISDYKKKTTPGQTGWVYGWGDTKSEDESSNTLRETSQVKNYVSKTKKNTLRETSQEGRLLLFIKIFWIGVLASVINLICTLYYTYTCTLYLDRNSQDYKSSKDPQTLQLTISRKLLVPVDPDKRCLWRRRRNGWRERRRRRDPGDWMRTQSAWN